MKVIHLKYNEYNSINDLAICLGFFDGMHIAHRKLFDETLRIGKAMALKTAIMTLSTQIYAYLKHEQFLALTSIPDKVAVAESLGFDYLFVLEVSDGLVRMEPEQFIQRFIANAGHVVVGFDYRFGHFGFGDADMLKNYLREKVTIVPEMDYYNKKIGSTRIRNLLKDAKLSVVSRLLGRPYQIIGKVVYGHRRGRSLGYPTANIDFDGYYLPKTGVYFTLIEHGGKTHYAMTNVGYNPTFSEQELSLETHILDLDEDLYGKTITIKFIEYIRPELKFSNREALVEQLKLDELAVRNIVKEEKS
ncbi:MAG: bifunctional riboflavin kinase/FAD synthetase [Bacilli bacterium]|nr:bifunctional riboflavin kinase/FAD synthetase [Bacilli bacterium]MBN2696445.1 bifunctional riboflavin kinase/FAD synthetase [Bacilli bacterium]